MIATRVIHRRPHNGVLFECWTRVKLFTVITVVRIYMSLRLSVSARYLTIQMKTKNPYKELQLNQNPNKAHWYPLLFRVLICYKARAKFYRAFQAVLLLRVSVRLTTSYLKLDTLGCGVSRKAYIVSSSCCRVFAFCYWYGCCTCVGDMWMAMTRITVSTYALKEANCSWNDRNHWPNAYDKNWWNSVIEKN